MRMMIFQKKILVILCLVLLKSCALIPSHNNVITIVSYNVRGTFGNISEEQKKAEQIALQLQEYGLEKSSVILFQEIDNDTVIRDLILEYLPLHGFRHAVTVPMDGSAITQAVISKYPIILARTHAIAHDDAQKTRSVLEVILRIEDHELALYNAHLKSKRGGVIETEPQRAAVMRLIRKKIERQCNLRPGLDVIIAGDMNSEVGEITTDDIPIALVPYDREIRDYDGLHVAQLNELSDVRTSSECGVFVSPWQDANWDGSYKYRDQWEKIDHFFLSTALFDNVAFAYDNFQVALNAQNIETNSVDLSPNKNTSDHLPIVLTLVLQ